MLRDNKGYKLWNNITLEQELQARAFMHKVAIVGGVLMNAIYKLIAMGISLPPSIIEKACRWVF